MGNIDEWVVGTNVAVAVTSILAAAATEHDAVKAMRDVVLGVFRTTPTGRVPRHLARGTRTPHHESKVADHD